jgi:CDGSH-type Zn-finger protein
MSAPPVSPKCALRGPYVLDLPPGDYLWCACGQSQRQPFCDGSHAGGPFEPLKLRVSGKARTVWLCGCKQSRHPPHCDGRHNKLPAS